MKPEDHLVNLTEPTKRPESLSAAVKPAKRLGFMYVAKKDCGRVAASCWDDADSKKETAKVVADYIKRGLTVERIERIAGDQMPEWICDECRGKPCKEAGNV